MQEKRVCIKCGKVLCVFNESDECWSHSVPKDNNPLPSNFPSSSAPSNFLDNDMHYYKK